MYHATKLFGFIPMLGTTVFVAGLTLLIGRVHTTIAGLFVAVSVMQFLVVVNSIHRFRTQIHASTTIEQLGNPDTKCPSGSSYYQSMTPSRRLGPGGCIAIRTEPSAGWEARSRGIRCIFRPDGPGRVMHDPYISGWCKNGASACQWMQCMWYEGVAHHKVLRSTEMCLATLTYPEEQ